VEADVTKHEHTDHRRQMPVLRRGMVDPPQQRRWRIGSQPAPPVAPDHPITPVDSCVNESPSGWGLAI
jgi:hypothetical protein